MLLPFCSASVVPSGVRMPWLMALLRNSTFAGSITTLVRGSRPLSTRKETPSPRRAVIQLMTGVRRKNAPIAKIAPRIPAEKLLTSISKPGRIRSTQSRSMTLSRYAASGPVIMAPRNIGLPPSKYGSPTVPTITPMVAMLATTPPRAS